MSNHNRLEKLLGVFFVSFPAVVFLLLMTSIFGFQDAVVMWAAGLILIAMVVMGVNILVGKSNV